MNILYEVFKNMSKEEILNYCKQNQKEVDNIAFEKELENAIYNCEPFDIEYNNKTIKIVEIKGYQIRDLTLDDIDKILKLKHSFDKEAIPVFSQIIEFMKQGYGEKYVIDYSKLNKSERSSSMMILLRLCLSPFEQCREKQKTLPKN